MADKPRKIVRKRVVKKRSENPYLESLKSILPLLWSETILPGIQDIVYHSGVEGLNHVIYRDEGAAPVSSSVPRRGGRTNYNKASTKAKRLNGPTIETVDKIAFETKEFAIEVLDSLYEILGQYGEVTVAEYYEAAGVTRNFTNRNWGWTNLRGSNVVRHSEGWVILLPDPSPLD